MVQSLTDFLTGKAALVQFNRLVIIPFSSMILCYPSHVDWAVGGQHAATKVG